MAEAMTKINTIQSLQNPVIKHLVKLRQNSDYRYEHESVIVEGPQLIQEVSQSHPIKRIVTIDECLVPPAVKCGELYVVSQAALDKISGLVHSPGILAEVQLPAPSKLDKVRFLLVIDRISDPGNLGTLIRSALAFGWEGVFVLDNSCDLFNEKAIRSARGATFRLPYALGSGEDLKKLLKKNRLKAWVADTAGTPLNQVAKEDSAALILSNESAGPSTDGQKITIPMPGPMESLNVAIAGSILLYHLKH